MQNSSEQDSRSVSGSEEDGEQEDNYIHGTLRDWENAYFEAEAPEIQADEIIRGEKLGVGTFGVVYKGQCRGEIVAIKELKESTVSNIEEFRKEVAIMSHLRHRNIVLMMGACTEKNIFCIITEYLPGGDLEKYLRNKQKEFSLVQKLKILKDVTLAMNWLHCSKPPIIHRDLKPGNIMLTEDLTAKVGDMGLSAINFNKKIIGDGAGSYLWMAPEALLFEPHNEKADVYSFAIVMWQMLAWEPDPFKKYLDLGDLEALVKAVCYRHERPRIPKGIHPRLVEIMTNGWSPDPLKRPSSSDIIGQINDAILKTTFVEESGAKFWKKHYGGEVVENSMVSDLKVATPFQKFAEALYKKMGLRVPQSPDTNPKYLCLKAMACDPAYNITPTVTIERFSLVTKWFGRIGAVSEQTNILDEIYKIMECNWFHGDISKEEAVILLSGDEKKRKKGTFLVRLSTSEPVQQNPFTITKLNAKLEIMHQRVYLKDDGVYYINIKDKSGDGEISSKYGLRFLIEELIKAKFVTEALPRTRYNYIFSAPAAKPSDLGYIEDSH
eukprot:TRINITY_DN2307_c0_g1_i1.p1 TRINITY_DN2307_c0_g1~~TRINITY_DN2307_c0_g1_i1.p1  ORF type:complete len:552 (+),score=125.92 TRINITY_DN2307_c0_g1_i1:59-1714(+)